MSHCPVCQVRFNKLLEKKTKQNEYQMSLYINNYGVKGKFNKIGTFIPYSDYMDKVCDLPAIVPVTQSDYAKRCFEMGIKDSKFIKDNYEYGEHYCNQLKAVDEALTKENSEVIENSFKEIKELKNAKLQIQW